MLHYFCIVRYIIHVCYDVDAIISLTKIAYSGIFKNNLTMLSRYINSSRHSIIHVNSIAKRHAIESEKATFIEDRI